MHRDNDEFSPDNKIVIPILLEQRLSKFVLFSQEKGLIR